MDLYAVYINNCCIGITKKSADKERTRALPPEPFITEALNKMGWWSYNAYLEDLPGHEVGEKFDIDFDGDYQCCFGGEKESDMKNPLVISFETPTIDKMHTMTLGDKLIQDSVDGGYGVCMLLLQPKMSDVVNRWELSDPPSYDELWFCSDWDDSMKPYDKVLKCYAKPDPESGSWFIAMARGMMVFAFIMLTFCMNGGGLY